MNSEFPPIPFSAPRFTKRRAEKPKLRPLSAELLARRGEIARILGAKVDILDRTLRTLSAEQRKALFYKVTHDGPVSLSGTGLKPLVDRSSNITLVVPTGENLDSFKAKLSVFETDQAQNGYVKNRDLARIHDIQPGQPKDRLSDELYADYEKLVKQERIICEIELLSLERGPKKQRAEIRDTLQALSNAFSRGVHGTLYEHEERQGCCRAVISVTGAMFQKLVEELNWQRRISWFEPKPRFETIHTIWDNFQFSSLVPIAAPDETAPAICIIDSGVSPGNPFLAPVVRDDLLHSFLKHEPENCYDETGHGSAVASLAAYNALNVAAEAVNIPKAWIASARILGKDNRLEDERLFSKLIEEAVLHFVARGVRIFNLSIGDRAKRWNQDTKRTQPRNSWVARTIDRLCYENDIVFVTAAGNLTIDEVQGFTSNSKPYPNYLLDESCRILDPAQAALALTVGSIAPGTRIANSVDTAIAEDSSPSPFTRTGPGIKRETKPELVDFGGNLTQNEDGTMIRNNVGLDVITASHQLSPAIARSRGTSLAAPRVAHKLAVVLHELQKNGLGSISAPLLKAFLVNSSAHRIDTRAFRSSMTGDTVGKDWICALGHGLADAGRATECDDYSALLFYQGAIKPSQIAYFEVPVPGDLIQSSGRKRLTVTVVHHPPVQRWGLESYLAIDLKWRMFRGNISREQIERCFSGPDEEDPTTASNVDTPQEIPFEYKLNRRSRGCIQHDWHEWQQHAAEYSHQPYTLAIASYLRWHGRKVAPIPFAVVVRVEELGGTVPIYAKIQSHVQAKVNVGTK